MTPTEPKPPSQIDFIDRCLDVALSETIKGITDELHQAPSGDALLMALAKQIGKRVGEMPERKDRRRVLDVIDKVIRVAVAEKAGPT